MQKLFGKRGGPNFGNMNQGPFNPNQQGQFNQYQQQGPFNPNPYGDPYNQQQNGYNSNLSSLYPGTQFERLQYEIKENRRRISNLTKRIIRLENYLRIRDNSDYIIDEDQVPNEFSL